MRKLIILLAAALCIFLVSMQWLHDKPQRDTVVIALAGDAMLGRSVSEALMRINPPQRYIYPWGNILSILKTADLALINLETTLTTSTTVVPKVFNFKADPDLVGCLLAAGIDVVNLANNHILDFGIEGLKETITILDKSKILHVGAGMDIHKAQKPVIIEKNGMRIGIIGYTDNDSAWLAQYEKPGTHYITVGNTAALAPITELKKLVDNVIVTIHWGPNMRPYPTEEFTAFAHAIIDAGADIIHGHSAHIFQGIELYKNKIILYDTGDLVDDYAVDSKLRNDLSFIFLVTLSKSGPTKIELIPTEISNLQVNHATGNSRSWLLQRMNMLCAQLGTHLLGTTIKIHE